MATRKQRARRAKTFRHEYGFVDTDEEGNVVEVAGAEVRAKKEPGSKPKTAAKGQPARKSRSTRDPQPPSWDRSLKRGGLWGALIVAASLGLLHGPVAQRVLIGVLYAALFIPFSYWIDGVIYKRWLAKRQGSSAGKTR
jgi:hypothetical protein